MFKDFTITEIDAVMNEAWKAFHIYRNLSLQQRAKFMRAIAVEIESCSDALIRTAMKETNLPEARLITERTRTVFQLNSYAAFCEGGQWMDLRIDGNGIVVGQRPTTAAGEIKETGLNVETGSDNIVGQRATTAAGEIKETGLNVETGSTDIVGQRPTTAETRSDNVVGQPPTTSSTIANYDLRKMLIPLGPVVVFGASNFPFAYSTAGGDTACAFAAGCPVIVKAHPAHAQTSEIIAKAILKAAAKCNMPRGIFAHVHGASMATGEYLVKHSHTKAVGFTGSFSGGKQLFDWGNQRKEPIPVFAEMGSVNPVFLLPEKLSLAVTNIAKQYAASISLSAGQFCTNPGIIIGIDNDDLKNFENILSAEIKKIAPAPMLNEGIYQNYGEKRTTALSQEHVKIIFDEKADSLPGLRTGRQDMQATTGNHIDVSPTITTITAANFLVNPLLQQEVFGPYSIIVRCADLNEMNTVAKNLAGQLTAAIIATENDIRRNNELVESIKNICGRLILNGVPTGVEVCLSMQHGGPFPATTDSRFTSVGADGIKRFARPICFQNWPDSLLPEELKNDNPLNLWRTINNELTKEKIN